MTKDEEPANRTHGSPEAKYLGFAISALRDVDSLGVRLIGIVLALIVRWLAVFALVIVVVFAAGVIESRLDRTDGGDAVFRGRRRHRAAAHGWNHS